MAFNLGAFAGGVGQGIEQGQTIRERYQRMVEQQRTQQAARIRAMALQGELQTPQVAPGAGMPPPGGGAAPPPPQLTPQGPGAGPPASNPVPVPMFGARLMQAPAPVQGPPPAAAPQPMPARPPAAPPAPAPAPPTPAAGAISPNPSASLAGPSSSPQGGGQGQGQDDDPFSGVNMQQMGAAYKQIEQLGHQQFLDTARQMMQSYKQQNGGKNPDPVAFLQAVEEQVKSMDGLDPTMKQIMLSEAQNNRLKMQFALGQDKITSGERNTDARVAATERGQDLTSGDRERGQDLTSGDRRRGQDMSFRASEDRTGEARQRDVWAHEDRGAAIDQRAASAGAGGLGRDLKIQHQFEQTEVGKAYSRTSSAIGEINDLAAEPDITQNAEAQLGLINRYLYMTTGSTRPPLAEYKKILGATDGQDVYDMLTGAIPYHPILGQDQIHNIIGAANTVADGAKKRAMADPLGRRALAAQQGFGDIGGGSGGGGSGGGKPQMTPQDIQQSLANARAAIKKSPTHRAAILQKLQDAGVPTQGL